MNFIFWISLRLYKCFYNYIHAQRRIFFLIINVSFFFKFLGFIYVYFWKRNHNTFLSVFYYLTEIPVILINWFRETRFCEGYLSLIFQNVVGWFSVNVTAFFEMAVGIINTVMCLHTLLVYLSYNHERLWFSMILFLFLIYWDQRQKSATTTSYDLTAK